MKPVTRWALGGDTQQDPFSMTLDLWDGEDLLTQVPLPPVVLNDLHAALAGVQRQQRAAMGIAEPEASIVEAPAKVQDLTGWRALTRGWRFIVVIAVGLMALTSLLLGLIPSAA